MGYPYYTLNAGSEKSGAFAFTISTNGTQAIEYWAKDNAENEEAAHNNVSFKIDKSSPVSSVAALSQYQTNSFSVSWSGSDIGDAEISSYTVQYKAESGDWTNWLTNTVLTESVFGPSSPITLQDQTTYYFRCLAKDNAGNIEEYPGSADAFTLIDTSSPSAPTINSSSHDEGVYNLTSNDPVFEWTIPSDVSGIAGYSMVLDHITDTSPDTVIDLTENTTTYTDVGDGSWYFHVRAKDNAGNWGEADTYGPVKIDVTTPTFSFIMSSSDPAKEGNIAISFIASEELSQTTVTVTQNGATSANVSMSSSDNMIWSGIYGVITDFDGTALISIEGMDLAGSTNTDTGNFEVDTATPTKPIISSSHPEDTPYSNADISFDWTSASDSGSGVEGYSYAVNQTETYSLDMSTETEGTSASSTTANGTFWFHLAAVDNAGNLSSADKFKFIIDTSSPTFTISASSNPAGQGPITITAAANEELNSSPSVSVQQNGQGAPTSVTMSSSDDINWTGLYSVVSGFDGTADINVSGDDLAGNTGNSSENFEVDTVSPTVTVSLSSTPPLGTGLFQATLVIVDASAISQTPYLDFTPLSAAAGEITLTGSDKNWQGDFFINPDTPEGTATFAFSATDAAGNTGNTITSGETFTIETTIDKNTGGTIYFEDGTKVELPPDAVLEDVNVAISTLTTETALINEANANITDDLSVSAIEGADLYREFTATEDISSLNITNFQTDITITIPYIDANQDGIVDGTGVKESELGMFHLNDVLSKWELVSNSQTDFSSNTVRASMNHFSIFSLMKISPSSLALNSVIAYPNPCYIKTQSYLRIGGIPLTTTNIEIYIYNVAGRLVRTLKEGSEIFTQVGSKVGKWDGKNSSGKKVASGVYIYVLKSDNGDKKEKFAIFW